MFGAQTVPTGKPRLDEFKDNYGDLLSRLREKNKILHQLADRFSGPIPTAVDNAPKPDLNQPSLLHRLEQMHSSFDTELGEYQRAIDRIALI